MTVLERLLDAEKKINSTVIELPPPLINGQEVTDEFVFPAGVELEDVRKQLRAAFKAQGVTFTTNSSTSCRLVLQCQAGRR